MATGFNLSQPPKPGRCCFSSIYSQNVFGKNFPLVNLNLQTNLIMLRDHQIWSLTFHRRAKLRDVVCGYAVRPPESRNSEASPAGWLNLLMPTLPEMQTLILKNRDAPAPRNLSANDWYDAMISGTVKFVCSRNLAEGSKWKRQAGKQNIFSNLLDMWGIKKSSPKSSPWA